MPIYEYYCEKCDTKKEMRQPMGSDPPECCGEVMVKVFNSPAMFRIEGLGYPSRRKWMDNFDPEQPTKFPTASVRGQKM